MSVALASISTEGPAPLVNHEAEQQILGAIMLNNEMARSVMAFLRPEHFAEPAHGAIYEACLRTIAEGGVANPVTLRPYFEGSEGLQHVGGASYLGRLAGATHSLHDTRHYGRLILDLAMRRGMVELSVELSYRAAAPEIEHAAPALIDDAMRRLSELRGEGELDHGTRRPDESLHEALAMIDAAHQAGGKVTGLTLGLRDLDEAVNGAEPGELLILAARPSMGKTALALQSLISAARAGAGACIFSIEMTARALAVRMACAEVWGTGDRIEYASALKGRLPRGASDWRRLTAAQARLSALPYRINELPAPTLAQVRVEAERLAAGFERAGTPLRLVIVDHLGLVAEPSLRGESEADRIGRITRGLKKLGRDLGCAVLALCQLNRGVEGREDKRPGLSDLRASGHIEQDADKVMFLYRPEYYLERAKPDEPSKLSEWQEKLDRVRGKAEIIVAKQRNGATPRIELMCDIGCNVFRDLGDDPTVQGDML